MADEDDEIDWRGYPTHDQFAAALSERLLRRIQRISRETGRSPQYVVNKMIYGMYNEARRLRDQRRSMN